MYITVLHKPLLIFFKKDIQKKNKKRKSLCFMRDYLTLQIKHIQINICT